MQLDLTEEQYRRLLELAFLGEWMANGVSPETERRKDLQVLADLLYAKANEIGITDWVEYCNDCEGYHANHVMESVVSDTIDKYDETTFWEVLSHHLAYRDVMLTQDSTKDMTPALEMRLFHVKEQYQREFQKHGLDHVRLVFSGGKGRR